MNNLRTLFSLFILNCHSKQPRIGFFLATLNGGGAEKVTLNLAKALTENNYYVELIVANTNGPLLKEVPASIPLIDLKAKRVSRSLFRLASHLKSSTISTLFSVLPHASIIAITASLLCRSNIRIIVSEHNTLSKSLANAKTFRGQFLHLPMKFAYRSADTVLAVSNGVADDISAVLGLPRSRIRVIYNPVIGPNFEKLKTEKIDHPWLASKVTPVVIAVGRLTKAKDFPTLLKAFSIVREKQPVRLIILGEGSDRATLEQLRSELNLEDDVSMPGFISNPIPLISKADVFVLSSIWEGLPTVLIEALACATPIVSTDCRSGPREILCNGRYGALVPVGDSVALAKKIDSYLIQPPIATAQTAWDSFSYKAVIHQYQTLIQEKV